MKFFIQAFKTSLPALFCYIPLGMIYGMLCAQSGSPWYYAPLFSLFIIAAAMQFLTLTLLAVGAPALMVLLAVLPIGIKNIFYGLTMLKRYQTFRPLLRIYLVHALVDATYTLLQADPKRFDRVKEDQAYITSLTILVHAYWVIGSLVGGCAGQWIQLPAGLEFALPAFFTATAVEQFLQKKEWFSLGIALSSMVVAWLVSPHYIFLGGLGCAFLLTLFLPIREKRTI